MADKARKRIEEKEEGLQAETENLLHKAKNLTWREKETIMAAIEAGKKA